MGSPSPTTDPQPCAGSHGQKQEVITPASTEASDPWRLRRPDPQQNGMVERVIRTIKKQCIHRQRFDSIRHATRAIGDWISFCNTRRPHQALARNLAHAGEEERQPPMRSSGGNPGAFTAGVSPVQAEASRTERHQTASGGCVTTLQRGGRPVLAKAGSRHGQFRAPFGH